MPTSALQSWLDQLPKGLDSHPQCRQKASIYRHFLDETPVPAALLEQLPEPLAELVRHPQPPSSWIPEVHTAALYLTVGEATIPDPDALQRHWYEVSKKLMGGPLYRVLMKVASPDMLLNGTQRRWSSMHQGTELTGGRTGPKSAELLLTYPSHLFPRDSLEHYGAAFEALFHMAGARDAHAPLVQHDATECRWQISW